jgi:hypothetical protein
MKIILRNTNLVFQSGNFDVDVFIDTQIETENSEFKSVITDAEDKVLWGRYVDNTTTNIDLAGYTIDDVAVTKIVNKIIEKYNL